MASKWYSKGFEGFCDGSVDWDADTIKCALISSSYTWNDDHDFWDDITGELSGTGYTAGGETLSNCAVNRDTGNDRVELDADDVTWTSIDAGTAVAAIIYKDTGAASTSPLIAYVEFSDPVVTNGGDFTIQWNAEGILQLASA